MKIKTISLIILLFISTQIVVGQEPEWLNTLKKIKPLIDNRNTTRSFFGEPFLIEENRDFFNLKEGKLVVSYSKGECSPTDLWGKWQVPKDTVLDLDFGVIKDIEFSDLKINLNGFKKEVPDDTPDLTLFTNKKLGIEYVRFQKYLSDVNIFPSKLQSSLRCKS